MDPISPCERSRRRRGLRYHSINAAAAVRRYDVDPRLDYRTVSGVNGKAIFSYGANSQDSDTTLDPAPIQRHRHLYSISLGRQADAPIR